MLDMQVEALHAALCEAFEVPPGRGDKAAVVRALIEPMRTRELGVPPSHSRYGDIVNGKVQASVKAVAKWCAAAGLEIRIRQNVLTYEPLADEEGP